MKDNTNNKEFWNNYVSYWESKVSQANEDKNAKDRTQDDIVYEKYFKKLNVKKEDNFLDFGCGYGRLYPIYKRNTNSSTNQGYYGIDVSGLTLSHAQKTYSDLKLGETLIEYDGSNIPFSDAFFDKVMCYAVFDATYQEKTIRELFRVMKPNGHLLLTGKNDKYCGDDDEALVAEINARKKEHPNSFTDVHKLVKIFEERGIEICDSYFFVRRKDIAIDHYEKAMPDVFYQWAFILRKSERYVDKEFPLFCDKYSKTFRKLENKEI